MTLRYVRLRDYDGHVHFVPNGQISSVINLTRGFAYAVVDIGVAYRENVDEVMAVMRERGGRTADASPPSQHEILDELEIAGVEKPGPTRPVVIRCRFRTVPLEQWGGRSASTCDG